MDKPRPFAEVIAELRRLDAAATPGPWVAMNDEDVDGRCWGIESPVHDDPGYSTEVVVTDSGVYPPRMPDAALIAAMRNALPRLLSRLASREAVFEAAVAVIAAEDMPPYTPFDGNSVEWDVKFDAEHKANLALRAAIAQAREAEGGS